MGGSVSADNVDETHEIGASRLAGSVVGAICCAPVLVIGACMLLGWNEQRAVCRAKALYAGEAKAEMVNCINPSERNGELVMLSCSIRKDGLPQFSSEGDFKDFHFVGVGLRTEAHMKQCVEHSESETRKDAVGGGKKTITTYTYSVEWSSKHVDDSTFKKKHSQNWRQNCGVDNPPWPAQVPLTGKKLAETMKVGSFSTRLTSSVPLDTPLPINPAPKGWVGIGGHAFMSSGWVKSNNDIGQVKVRFYGNDWAHPEATLLGKNLNGKISSWTAPASWLCGENEVEELKMGAMNKQAFFKSLHEDSHVLTWILRVVGFAVMWLAFSLLFGPLEVMADCIPCIGPCLGDSIAAVTCCVSCLPATACCCLIVGIVWVAMRPLVGGPLLGAFFFVAVALLVFKHASAGKAKGLMAQNATPQYGAAQVATVAAQPVRQMQVQVPAGVGPGDLVQATTPEGIVVNVQVPATCGERDVFWATY